MLTHKRVHNSTEDLKCLFCTDKFHTNQSRQKHMETIHHKLTVSHRCFYPGCGKEFPMKYQLLSELEIIYIYFFLLYQSKNIGKNGLQYLTNIYNAAINDNKIPHVWELANIIPIPKPNKDINIGTSYRPIFLLSVIAKTLEKMILPYITQNIPNITT